MRPGNTATICLKALEREPARRFHSAASFADDLDRWLRHEPVHARAIGPVRRLGKWIKRHPMGLALVLVALLAM